MNQTLPIRIEGGDSGGCSGSQEQNLERGSQEHFVGNNKGGPSNFNSHY